MVIYTMYIKTDDMWNNSLYDIYLYVLVILSKKKKKTESFIQLRKISSSWKENSNSICDIKGLMLLILLIL